MCTLCYFLIYKDRTICHMFSHLQHIRGDFVSLSSKRITLILYGWEHSPHSYHNSQLQWYVHKSVCQPAPNIRSSIFFKVLILRFFLIHLISIFYTLNVYILHNLNMMPHSGLYIHVNCNIHLSQCHLVMSKK